MAEEHGSYSSAEDIVADVISMRYALRLLAEKGVEDTPAQRDLVKSIAERLLQCQNAYHQTLVNDYRAVAQSYDAFMEQLENGTLDASDERSDPSQFIAPILALRKELADEEISWKEIEDSLGIAIMYTAPDTDAEAQEDADADVGDDGDGSPGTAYDDDGTDEESSLDSAEKQAHRAYIEGRLAELAVDDAAGEQDDAGGEEDYSEDFDDVDDDDNDDDDDDDDNEDDTEFEKGIAEAFDIACRCCPVDASKPEQQSFLRSFFDRFDSPAQGNSELRDLLVQWVIDELPNIRQDASGSEGGPGSASEYESDSEASDGGDQGRKSRLAVDTDAAPEISLSADGYPTISPVRRKLHAKEMQVLDFAEDLIEPTVHPAISPRRRASETIVDSAMDHIEDVESASEDENDNEGTDGSGDDGADDAVFGEELSGDEDSSEISAASDPNEQVSNDDLLLSDLLQRVLRLIRRGRPAFEFMQLLLDRLETLPVESRALHAPLLNFFDALQQVSDGGEASDGGVADGRSDSGADEFDYGDDDYNEDEGSSAQPELPVVIRPKVMVHLPEADAFDYAESAMPVERSAADPVYVRDIVQDYRDTDFNDPEVDSEEEETDANARALVPHATEVADGDEADFLRKSLAATQAANFKMQNHLIEQSKAFKDEMSEQMGQLTCTLNEKLDDLANKLSSSPPPLPRPTGTLATSAPTSSPAAAARAAAAAHDSPARRHLDDEVANLRAQIDGTAKLIESRRNHNEDIVALGSPLRAAGAGAAVSQATPSVVRASAVATVLTASGEVKTYTVNVDMGGDALEVPVPKGNKLINLTVELPERIAPAQDVTYQVAPMPTSGAPNGGDGRLRLQFDGQPQTPPKIFAVNNGGDVDD